MTAADLIAQLQQIVPSLSLQPVEAADGELNPTILVAAAQIENVCGALRDTPGLEFVAFSDVTAADHFPGRRPRFDVATTIRICGAS